MGVTKKKVVVEPQLVYTVNEVAKILRVNKNKVYEFIDYGLLDCIVLGSKKVTHDAILAFLEKFQNMDLTNPNDVKKVFRRYQ